MSEIIKLCPVCYNALENIPITVQGEVADYTVNQYLCEACDRTYTDEDLYSFEETDDSLYDGGSYFATPTPSGLYCTNLMQKQPNKPLKTRKNLYRGLGFE